jgi:hypothetical protein
MLAQVSGWRALAQWLFAFSLVKVTAVWHHESSECSRNFLRTTCPLLFDGLNGPGISAAAPGTEMLQSQYLVSHAKSSRGESVEHN